MSDCVCTHAAMSAHVCVCVCDCVIVCPNVSMCAVPIDSCTRKTLQTRLPNYRTTQTCSIVSSCTKGASSRSNALSPTEVCCQETQHAYTLISRPIHPPNHTHTHTHIHIQPPLTHLPTLASTSTSTPAPLPQTHFPTPTLPLQHPHPHPSFYPTSTSTSNPTPKPTPTHTTLPTCFSSTSIASASSIDTFSERPPTRSL